jgi:hypothetical protein
MRRDANGRLPEILLLRLTNLLAWRIADSAPMRQGRKPAREGPVSYQQQPADVMSSSLVMGSPWVGQDWQLRPGPRQGVVFNRMNTRSGFAHAELEHLT